MWDGRSEVQQRLGSNGTDEKEGRSVRQLVRSKSATSRAAVRLSSAGLRRLGLAGAVGASALVFAACGGPSAGQSATATLEAGIAAQRAGDYGTATTDYEKVLRTDPKNAWALYDLGDVEQFQNQGAAAQTHYIQALAINPRLENAMYNLAILVWKTNPTEAKSLYVQVIHMSPGDGPAHLNLGKVELKLGETKAAQQQFAIAVHLEPSLRALIPAS